MPKKIAVCAEYSVIVLLGAIMAFGYVLFIVPNDFAPAGINGIAVMVQYRAGFSIGYMSLLVNIPLCLFAFFFVDKKFAIKTLVFVVAYSLSYILFQKIEALNNFIYDAEGVDTVYPVIISGLLSGAGYGILFRLNSSSGGTDIIAKYVSKKRPYLNFFWITFCMNAVVAVASCFVYSDGGILNYKPACLCLLYCFVSSFVGNVMIKGAKSAYKFIVITQHPEEIEKEIIGVLHHSATRLDGYGIYTGNKKTVLMCVVNKHQLVDFEGIVKRFPETFAFVEAVAETLGNFKKIK